MQELILAAALLEARANLSQSVRTGAHDKEIAARRGVILALEEAQRLMNAGQAWQGALANAMRAVAALEPAMAQMVPQNVLAGRQRRALIG